MKIHKVHDATILMLGDSPPPSGFDLCIYEAEDGDGWQGFVAGPAGLGSAVFQLANASATYQAALARWMESHQGRGQHPPPDSLDDILTRR
jgi:hypothetical protein